MRRGLFGGQQSLARLVQSGHSLDDEQVDAGVSQGPNLFREGGTRFIESGFAQRFEPDAKRSDGAGDICSAGLLLLEMIDSLAGQFDAGGIDFGNL